MFFAFASTFFFFPFGFVGFIALAHLFLSPSLQSDIARWLASLKPHFRHVGFSPRLEYWQLDQLGHRLLGVVPHYWQLDSV